MSDRSLCDDALDELARSRATLLPEERAADSDDPQAQAKAVLADSEERTDGCAADSVERRRSEDVASDDRS